MIGKMIDLVFGCRHRQITRPITPVHRHNKQPSATYVVCLECGKQFYYDATNMRLGVAMPVSLIAPDRGSGAFQSQS